MTRERIKDFKEIILPFFTIYFLKENYEGLGKSDAEEFEKDFNEILNLAAKALEQQPYEKFESAKDHIYKLAGDYKCWDNRLTEDEAVELCHILEQEPCYNPDEWCHDCSEYDHDKHCCHRWSKVIRNTVEEMKQPKMGHWISYWDEEARCYVYKCPECGNKQPFDTKCCWECGTRLVEPHESEKTDERG